ncbi:MAG: PP2C family protein-serine/threonine phosphatase, partial [Treponema sp.]
RVLFILEACFLVNISFCFIYYTTGEINSIASGLKGLLYIFSFYIAFFKFNAVEMSPADGIIIKSPYIFSDNVSIIFPWTWVTVYAALYRFILPAFCCLIMLLGNEYKVSRIQKYRGYVDAFALLVMWGLLLFISIVSRHNPGLYLLYHFAYVFLILIMTYASSVKTSPSGSDAVMAVFRAFLLYIIPGIVMGLVYAAFFDIYAKYSILFFLILEAGTFFILFYISKVSDYLTKTRLLHSADYEHTFEKDLASIDYSGEMDEITNNMFNIFKKNVECSSMSVFINNGEGKLDTAYSSKNETLSVSLDNPVFDELLNIGKTVVVYSEIDNEHDLAEIKDKLAELFKVTESDALFILNEGRNILGFIVLGIKTSGDHYKDYDISVFTKLYSYFFVFGYYMRNISNKDIIGTVNREIRMSSQIITSIQENMDPVRNPKIDVGYIMVPAHNIGGEFIDLIRLNNRSHLFVVGDLSGKGIAASMSMVILKSIIRTYLAETHDFKQLVVKVNSFIRNSLQKGTIFAGMFALVDFQTDTMYYINCGIPALFLYTQAYNNVIEIQGSGHILGFVKDISPFISVKQIKLNKGDIVLTCTDGIINSHSLRGEQFGKERVQQVLLANSMYPASRMAQFEYDSLVKFMSKEMEDDVSVLVMKYQEADTGVNAEIQSEPEEQETIQTEEMPSA